jgi:hypothetical protein
VSTEGSACFLVDTVDPNFGQQVEKILGWTRRQEDRQPRWSLRGMPTVVEELPDAR